MKEDLKIIFLPKEEWEGTVIPMRYTTEEYYDVQIERDAYGFNVRMQKRNSSDNPLVIFLKSDEFFQ